MEIDERDRKIIGLLQALIKTDHGLSLIGKTLEEGGHALALAGNAPAPAGGLNLEALKRGVAQETGLVADALGEAGFALMRQIEKTPFPAVTDPVRIAMAKAGIILDTETTGLEPGKDRIVQLSMLKFLYDDQGILSLGDFFDEYHDPGIPMSAEARMVTGITPEMLDGKKITSAQIREFMGGCSMIVAHNAAFDRKFCEADFPDAGFDRAPWHCSMAQVDWQARGIKGRSLELIALKQGYVYGAHNAFSDVTATGFALDARDEAGRTAFAEMFERGNTPSIMIIAEKSPFESKDDLKSNGYSWSSDGAETGGIKAWFKVVARSPENVAREGELLRGCYGRDVSLPAWEMDQTILYSARKPVQRATFRTAEARSAMENLRMMDHDQPSLL